jgi:hypothetical protein
MTISSTAGRGDGSFDRSIHAFLLGTPFLESEQDADVISRLFRPLDFRMNKSLADQELFGVDNLIEAVCAKGAIQPVVPHFQQPPLAADGAAAETRIMGPFY